MRRAVERRVLDEVREPELIVRFEDRARVDDEPKLGALFGFGVLADVVADAVRQRADAHFGIERQRRAERRSCCGRRGFAAWAAQRRGQRNGKAQAE